MTDSVAYTNLSLQRLRHPANPSGRSGCKAIRKAVENLAEIAEVYVVQQLGIARRSLGPDAKTFDRGLTDVGRQNIEARLAVRGEPNLPTKILFNRTNECKAPSVE